MAGYLTKAEEKQIRKLIDELADEFGLYCEKRNVLLGLLSG
mgnify:CR=1 FL=1